MAKVLFYQITREKFDLLEQKEATNFYRVAEGDGSYSLYLGESLLTSDPSITNRVEALETAISILNNNDETVGSIDYKIKQAIDTLDTKIGTLEELDTADKSSIVAAINECLAAIGTGGTESVVTVEEKSVPTEGYLKSYNIKQGGQVKGTIDIPKELVVTSGEIITVDVEHPVEDLANGTYLKLTIANQVAPVYIDVAKMCDVYTAEGGAAQVQLAISEDNEISASIVAGSISATELAANAVETTKIKNASVTEAKLSAELQAWKQAVDAALEWQEIV